MNKTGIMAAALALALALPFAAAIDFKYELIETGKYADGIKITSYTGSSKTVTYPAEIEGYPVLVIVGNVEKVYPQAVVIPEGVREISGFGALNFGDQTSMRSLALPSTLEVIGDHAFDSSSLQSIDLSRCVNLTTIGESAFASSGLTSIDLSRCARLTTIGKMAFKSTKITSLDLSRCTSLTTIGERAFSDELGYTTVLKTVQLPDSVTEIGMMAFYRCHTLTSVNLPANLKRIGFEAFAGCGELSKLSIPESITAVIFEKEHSGGAYVSKAFAGCGKLPIAARKRLQALEGFGALQGTWLATEMDPTIIKLTNPSRSRASVLRTIEITWTFTGNNVVLSWKNLETGNEEVMGGGPYTADDKMIKMADEPLEIAYTINDRGELTLTSAGQTLFVGKRRQ